MGETSRRATEDRVNNAIIAKLLQDVKLWKPGLNSSGYVVNHRLLQT